MTIERYLDRRHAGMVLAEAARAVGTRAEAVLALPRGGVPVALEVALALRLPLDVLPVRKLGMPGQEELAIGALAAGAPPILNERLVRRARLAPEEIGRTADEQSRELRRQEMLYRRGRPAFPVAGQSIVLVDDGLATGYTLRAAIAALRRAGVSRLTVAVPVGPPESCERIASEADVFLCPLRPPDFMAVGEWYDDFSPTSDDDVMACLARARSALTGH